MRTMFNEKFRDEDFVNALSDTVAFYSDMSKKYRFWSSVSGSFKYIIHYGIIRLSNL
jgi:hypothetical protein